MKSFELIFHVLGDWNKMVQYVKLWSLLTRDVMDVTLEIMSNRQILIGLSLSAQYQKLICIAVLVLLVSLKILYKFPTFPLGEGFLDFFINVKKEKKTNDGSSTKNRKS